MKARVAGFERREFQPRGTFYRPTDKALESLNRKPWTLPQVFALGFTCGVTVCVVTLVVLATLNGVAPW